MFASYNMLVPIESFQQCRQDLVLLAMAPLALKKKMIRNVVHSTRAKKLKPTWSALSRHQHQRCVPEQPARFGAGTLPKGARLNNPTSSQLDPAVLSYSLMLMRREI
jgi:hypothetical protein